MSRIDKLIQELCPNGVKYEKLIDITSWDKKFNRINNSTIKPFKHISAERLKELKSKNGVIKLLSTGNFEGYADEERCMDFINEGEIITLPSGGTANIKYYNGKFLDSGNLIAISKDINLYDSKYIYYNLLNIQSTIQSYYRGSGVKHPDMNNILNIFIPVPPLEVQCEIVHILDDFTLLSAELSTELKARQKQYDYYKQKIFDDIKTDNIKHITDIALVKARVGWQRLTRAEYLAKGDYYLITGTDFTNDGNINFESCVFVSKDRYDMDKNIQVHKDDILITKDGTLGKVAILKEEPEKKTTLNSGVFRIKVLDEKEVYPKYLYHFFTSKYFKDFVESVKTGSTIPHLTQQGLVTLDIPIPSINEQVKIVKILDNFDILNNDISEGLPAEIEARKKQYEYYRDKLLTFKELKKEG